MRRIILGLAIAAAGATTAGAAGFGTVSGSVTTQGGLPLNGMCGVLYNSAATKQLVAFAGTGTDGTPGNYTQANVKPGTYVLLFVNCGANTGGGSPDFHYTPIFLGGTWSSRRATKVVVTAGQTTTLGPAAVPYGGLVTGTVTDTTTGQGADSPPVAYVPPGGKKFFLRFSWTIVCASAAGNYQSNFGFGQGVPNGSKMYFAPNGWGCTNSQGVFNAGKFFQSVSAPVSVGGGGAAVVNGAVGETGS